MSWTGDLPSLGFSFPPVKWEQSVEIMAQSTHTNLQLILAIVVSAVILNKDFQSTKTKLKDTNSLDDFYQQFSPYLSLTHLDPTRDNF